jgi:site-specific DNA recombinase
MGSLVRSVVRALLYVRVSTSEQGTAGYSLRQQLEALRSYCKDNNIEVVAEFEDTSSGASLDRPGLDALRDTVSLGGIGPFYVRIVTALAGSLPTYSF